MITPGRIVVVGGASQSGKTSYVRQATQKQLRVFAYDPEDQWSQLPGWKRFTSKADFIKAIQTPGKIKAAFVAGGDLQKEFDFWAGCMMYSGRYVEPLSCIAEELSDVTNPGKAPGNWGILLRRGLKRGITIYAISQRWSEADKTAVGNASEFVLFRQSSADDVRYLSKKTRIPEQELNGLQQFDYVVFDAVTGQLSKNKLKF